MEQEELSGQPQPVETVESQPVEEPGSERSLDVEKAHEEALEVHYFRKNPDLKPLVIPHVERRLLRAALQAMESKQTHPVVEWVRTTFHQPIQNDANRQFHDVPEKKPEEATEQIIKNAITRSLYGKQETLPIRQIMGKMSLEELMHIGHLEKRDLGQAFLDVVDERKLEAYQTMDHLFKSRVFMNQDYGGLDYVADVVSAEGPEVVGNGEQAAFPPGTVEALARSCQELLVPLRAVIESFQSDPVARHDLDNVATAAITDIANLRDGVAPEELSAVLVRCQNSLAALCFVLDDVLSRHVVDEKELVRRLAGGAWVLGVESSNPAAHIQRRLTLLNENALPFQSRYVANALLGLRQTNAGKGRVQQLMDIEWGWEEEHVFAAPPTAIINGIFNAITNAARESVGATSIVVSCDDDKERQELVFRVRDNGKGIPENLMTIVDAQLVNGQKPAVERVPLFTYKGMSGSESTGIGTAGLPERMHDIGVTYSVVSNGRSYTNRRGYDSVEELKELGKQGTVIEWRVPYTALPTQETQSDT